MRFVYIINNNLRMELQTQTNQQAELKILLLQNQELYKKRAEHLVKRLQALLNNQNDNDLLDSIHLAEAINYVNEVAEKKQEQAQLAIPDGEEIEKEIEMQARKENQILQEEIQKLTNQIQQMEKKKLKYQLAQKYTSNRILNLEDILSKHNFSLDLTNIFGNIIEPSPSLYFSYDELPDGSMEFKDSYIKILKHFFNRMRENQEIIAKLEQQVKQKVSQTQKTRISIEKLKKMKRQYDQIVALVSKIKNQCQYQKQELKRCLQETSRIIQQRLPAQIDKNLKEISSRKTAYEKAYYSLIQVVKKVINNAELSKVTEYINKK